MPTRPTATPASPEQQAHRTGFGLIARLSSDLKEVHAIGLHKESLHRRRGERRRTTFDVFKHLNRACFTADGADYTRLVVSKGPLASPDITSARLAPDGTLTVGWSNDFFPGDPADELILAAYCPALRACLQAEPAPRSACAAAVRLPAAWLRTGPVHLYAFFLGQKRFTSDSVHLPLPSPTAADAPQPDPTNQFTDPINPPVDPIKHEIDPINIPGDPINTPHADPTNPLLEDPTTLGLYRAVLAEPTLPYAGYAQRLGVSEATVKRRLQQLKACGLLRRQGPNKNGRWLPPLPPAAS